MLVAVTSAAPSPRVAVKERSDSSSFFGNRWQVVYLFMSGVFTLLTVDVVRSLRFVLMYAFEPASLSLHASQRSQNHSERDLSAFRFRPPQWLFWSRGQNCCAEVRLLLDCEPSPLAECRGVAGGGDCSLLAAQFRTVEGSGIPPDYVCGQFPDGAHCQIVIVCLYLACLFALVPAGSSEPPAWLACLHSRFCCYSLF